MLRLRVRCETVKDPEGDPRCVLGEEGHRDCRPRPAGGGSPRLSSRPPYQGTFSQNPPVSETKTWSQGSRNRPVSPVRRDSLSPVTPNLDDRLRPSTSDKISHESHRTVYARPHPLLEPWVPTRGSPTPRRSPTPPEFRGSGTPGQ